MKIALLLPVLFCCATGACAQAGDIDSMHTVKARTDVSVASLSKYIQQHYHTDEAKLQAAYAWVTANIRYDTDSMYAINANSDDTAKVSAAMRRRKGVCENFAAIFTALANGVGVQACVVTGYTKQGSRVNKSGHGWCAVYLHDEWLLCDPTWDAGYAGEPHYFLVSPAAFNEVHMPFDPMWQLSEHPVTAHEFYNGFSHRSGTELIFNFKDSIQAYLKMNEVQRLITAAARIEKAGVESELIKVRLAFIKMRICMNYEDKSVELYNLAVKGLNEATVLYNKFIAYRNTQFTPAMPDAATGGLLQPMGDVLLAAVQKLDMIASSPAPWQMDTGLLRSKLTTIMGRLQEQQQFLQQYLALPPAERTKLFYATSAGR